MLETVGLGRSTTWADTTATLPSIPPRCSRLPTQPPSTPTSIGFSACGAAGGSCLQGPADPASRQFSQKRVGRTKASSALQAAKAPSWHPHPSKERGDHPAHRAFQAALLASTVLASLLLLFLLSNRLFEGFAHGLLANLLHLLFDLRSTGTCRNFKRERDLYLHERFLLL